MQTIVFTQLFHLFNSRSIRQPAFNRDFFSNKSVFVVALVLIALQMSISYIPFMNEVFETSPINLADWKYPLGLGLIIFFVVEIEKWVVRLITKS